ncbi:hypothetical protein PO909_009353 [Leuciscus waleckii]
MSESGHSQPGMYGQGRRRRRRRDRDPGPPGQNLSGPSRDRDYVPRERRYLRDQTDMLVVGVIGLQGTGKSTIMSLLSANSPEEDQRAYVFRAQTQEIKERAGNQSSGIDFYITQERVIFLDTQPILSPSILDHLINNDRKLPPEYNLPHTYVEMQSLQITAFLFTVCHVVIVIQDWFTDINLYRFLQTAEMLKPSTPSASHDSTGSSGADDGSEYYPHIVFLQNKARREEFCPRNLKKMHMAVDKLMAHSHLKYKGTLSMLDCNIFPGLSRDYLEAEVNLFLLPMMENDGEDALTRAGFTMLLEFGMELRSHLHSLSIAGCYHSHDGVKKPEYYKTIISTYNGFSDDSSDEDDYKAPLAVTSEESSMCCVCGDSIPFLEQAATNDTCSDIQKRIDNDTNSTNQASRIKTETERLPLIKDEPVDTFSFSSFPLNQSEPDHLSFRVKEENDNEHGLGGTVVNEVAAEEEICLAEDQEGTDTGDEANPDSLPPGDTAYNPDEDLSSDSDDINSKCVSHRRHLKTKRGKQQVPNRKRSANINLESINIAEKFGFQSDSPFCCYGKFANLKKHMDDCRNKLMFPCCLCSVACETEELLMKHMIAKHPAAGYICAFCHNVFPRQDNFKNHICRKRPTGETNLPATSVSHLPTVPLSNSSGQGRPSAPTLYANQNTIKVIKIIQTANKASTAPDPPPAVATLGSTEVLTLQHLLQTTPLGTAKVTNLVPQVVAMPQTLVRPNFLPSSCVARPKFPIHTPSVVRPLLTNPARMTLRIPALSNPPLPTSVIVSFSPTVNVSGPTFVSSNKPVLRQTSVANIRPLPVNVLPMTSVTFPTLVSALTGNNHPQVPPAQVQAPLKVVAMFMNQSRHLALQKRREESWRSKTIFPCRHCGAVSRQPSLRVRHRYLHRGSRLYRCQCGRSFQQQLHLLRHQVQHAESVRFVCARCGNTFEGAHKLTWHKRKHKKGKQAKKKCKAAFDCSCGQMFARPSALLWHMLKNAKLSKRTRKTSHSVSLGIVCK